MRHMCDVAGIFVWGICQKWAMHVIQCSWSYCWLLFIGGTGEASANSLFRPSRKEFQVNTIFPLERQVLKGLFIGDTEENSALHVHCSGIFWDRALSDYDSFLFGRWPWNDHSLVSGEDFLHIHCWDLPKDRALRWCDIFNQKIVLKRPFS